MLKKDLKISKKQSLVQTCAIDKVDNRLLSITID